MGRCECSTPPQLCSAQVAGAHGSPPGRTVCTPTRSPARTSSPSCRLPVETRCRPPQQPAGSSRTARARPCSLSSRSCDNGNARPAQTRDSPQQLIPPAAAPAGAPASAVPLMEQLDLERHRPRSACLLQHPRPERGEQRQQPARPGPWHHHPAPAAAATRSLRAWRPPQREPAPQPRPVGRAAGPASSPPLPRGRPPKQQALQPPPPCAAAPALRQAPRPAQVRRPAPAAAPRPLPAARLRAAGRSRPTRGRRRRGCRGPATSLRHSPRPRHHGRCCTCGRARWPPRARASTQCTGGCAGDAGRPRCSCARADARHGPAVRAQAHPQAGAARHARQASHHPPAGPSTSSSSSCGAHNFRIFVAPRAAPRRACSRLSTAKRQRGRCRGGAATAPSGRAPPGA